MLEHGESMITFLSSFTDEGINMEIEIDLFSLFFSRTKDPLSRAVSGRVIECCGLIFARKVELDESMHNVIMYYVVFLS